VIQPLTRATTIAIPPGVAHGFYTEEGCVLLYALSEEYDGTDEYGFWPFSGLTEDSHPGWPRDHIGIVVSERDLRAPKLEDFQW
jgi:dTDP-4-dehydrorhamnose 3,5-epimerase-like enzyme